jgi:hypothetical protein
VEHRCYQCGAAVEDGTAFCPQCNAPQIRVTIENPESATEILPKNLPSLSSLSPSRSGLRPASTIQWPQALPAAFLGLLIATLLSTLASGAFWFGMLIAGFLSVYFYRRRNPLVHLTLRLGARLGALSGAFGFAITAIATSTAIAVLHSGKELHALVLKTIQEQMSRTGDPRMQPFLDLYSSRQGFILMLALGSIIMFILFLALSSMGGVLGAAMLRRKDSI